MATPNYSYEKRQRELAKKRKAEDKRSRKTTPGSGDQGGYPDMNQGPSGMQDAPTPSPASGPGPMIKP